MKLISVEKVQMKKELIGRHAELEALQKRCFTQGFQMAVIYGQQGVGKTALINEFADSCHCNTIFYTASECTESRQLEQMGNAVLTALAPELPGVRCFERFDSIFDVLAKVSEKKRIIFVIDKYPYLAQCCRYMNSLIQKYADHEWKNTNLFLILCGSSEEYMIQEVIGSNAPLYGRSTVILKLRPFDYYETAAFVPKYTNAEKAAVYGLTRGIARDLAQIDPSLSLDENVRKKFCSESGCFSEETMKPVFREMCRQYIFRNVGTARVPVLVTDVAEYQSRFKLADGTIKQIELELLGTVNSRIVLVGECKFKNEKFDKDELENFLDKIQYLPAGNPSLMLFSLSGFTAYVTEHAEGMTLVDIGKMYAG